MPGYGGRLGSVVPLRGRIVLREETWSELKLSLIGNKQIPPPKTGQRLVPGPGPGAAWMSHLKEFERTAGNAFKIDQ